MTIEVRQMLIRSVVGDEGQHPGAMSATRGHAPPGADLERLRAQLLAECKAWLAEQLRAREER
jgi:hypothetical protein